MRIALLSTTVLTLSLLLVLPTSCTPEEGAEATCESYCETVMANCTGASAQYSDSQQCLDTCSTGLAWAAGAATDESGNTIGCRVFHAGAANNDAHCVHAGPTGGEACGGYCDVYCDAAMQNCAGENALYADATECAAACAAFPKDGAVNAADGDSLQCRLYHLGAAASDAATHCPHGGADGGGVCAAAVASPTCANYCDLVMDNCTGASAQYADAASCLETCYDGQAWPVGASGDAEGNTIGCREFHAGAAANDDHCVHAGPTGGEACGSYCDVYCDAATNNCGGLYADAATCQAACARFPATGAVNDAEGNSVQCRIFHVTAAETAPSTHCPHASASGANVCGTWCENYCDTIQASCTGGNAQYASAAECTTACAAFPATGAPDDATGDTVQCRLFHAGAAFGDPTAHCAHAGPTSTADTCQ